MFRFYLFIIVSLTGFQACDTADKANVDNSKVGIYDCDSLLADSIFLNNINFNLAGTNPSSISEAIKVLDLRANINAKQLVKSCESHEIYIDFMDELTSDWSSISDSNSELHNQLKKMRCKGVTDNCQMIFDLFYYHLNNIKPLEDKYVIRGLERYDSTGVMRQELVRYQEELYK